MAEKEELQKQLVEIMRFSTNTPEEIEIEGSNIFKLMLECAKKNAGKKKKGWDYFDVIKEFSTVVYTLGGPYLYFILSKNLPFPSLTTTRRMLHSNSTIIEGAWRFSELKSFLIQRNFPLVIWVSEDGTRVNGRIQYDVKTNQLVGFVPEIDVNGLPAVLSFPATSASVMKSYFDNCTVSNNTYVVMAQPLAQNAPTFCLAVWGTDNRFRCSDVLARWRWMFDAAAKEGITIAGVSSDGDTKLLSAMYNCTFQHVSHNWSWFHAELKPKFVTIQDSIHLLVKLRQKIIKPSDIMPMGNTNLASRGHLLSLISSVSKDHHKLTLTTINVKDKMNFRSAQTLCAQEVSTLLRKEIPNSEGTAVFLDMMRETTAAFLDPSLKPLERINMAWTWVFFVRFWRQFILSNPDYSLAHNFITSNAYTCMEINAHALIQIMSNLRDLELHNLFLPMLFSSQPCEAFFRQCRSMTSFGSTMINASVLEVNHKAKRIDFLANSFESLKNDVCFPRQHKKLYSLATSEKRNDILPEDFEIQQEAAAALKRAVQIAIKVGILKKNTLIYPICPLPSVSRGEMPGLEDEEDDDNDNEEENQEENPVRTMIGEIDETMQDVQEDLLTISSGALGVKSYDNLQISSESPFVLVADGNDKPAVMKKTTLVWMLSSGDTSMSSDRLRRVQTEAVVHNPSTLSLSPTQLPVVEEVVGIGDWCAFTSEDRKNISIGRILAFSYLSGPTWRSQQFVGTEAPVHPPTTTKPRGVGCLCTWYTLLKSRKLQVTSMEVHGYYNIDNYICTLPRPNVKDNNLFLSCSEIDIRKLMKKKK